MCYRKRLLVKSPLARNVGRERRAACSGSVYYVLTALSMVKVNDIIPLCTVMKQLGEDSISARCVTRLRYRGWRARPAQPPRPAHGRGKAAEGSKGSNNQQGHSLLKGPGPHTWEGQWPHPAVSHLGPQHPIGFWEATGTGRHFCSWLLPPRSPATWLRFSKAGVTLPPLLLLILRDTYLKRADTRPTAGQSQMENGILALLGSRHRQAQESSGPSWRCGLSYL